jgi:hypothetical protein
MNVDLIGHDAIVTKLDRLMEAETISYIFRFLKFELHDDFVEV